MSRGKAFERELKQGFERAGWLAYRNVDAMTGKGKSSVRSLPDMWAFHEEGVVLLLEAKVVKGKSLPFTRLAVHQADALSLFDAYGYNYNGGIVVCYYGDKPRWKRAFIIDIDQWLRSETNLTPRKSFPITEAEAVGTELPWTPGKGWEIPKTIQGGIY